MSPSLRCPRCATVIAVEAHERPVCPGCGFSGDAVPRPSVAGGAAPPPTYSAGGVPSVGAQAPRPAGPPGQPREPWLVLLLYAVTLGVYGLFWYWWTGKEVDRFRPETRAFPLMKWGVILQAISLVLVLVLLVVMTVTFVGLMAEGEEAFEEKLEQGPFLQGFAALILLYFLMALVGLAATVLLYMGLWRVWNMTRREQVFLGNPHPVQPGLLLLLVLSPLLLNLVSLPFSFIPFVGALVSFGFGMAGIVAAGVAYWMTQDALNGIWRAHGQLSSHAPGPGIPA